MSEAPIAVERDRAAARLLGRMPRLIASAQDLEEGLRRSAELVAEAARADVAAIRLGSVGSPAIVHRRHPIGDASIDTLPTRLVVPLVLRGRRLGVLTVARQRRRPFSAAAAVLVEAFAGPIALAVDNARLFGALQDRLAELSRLGEASEAVAALGDLEEVGAQVARRAADLVEAERAAVLLLDPLGRDPGRPPHGVRRAGLAPLAAALPPPRRRPERRRLPDRAPLHQQRRHRRPQRPLPLGAGAGGAVGPGRPAALGRHARRPAGLEQAPRPLHPPGRPPAGRLRRPGGRGARQRHALPAGRPRARAAQGAGAPQVPVPLARLARAADAALVDQGVRRGPALDGARGRPRDAHPPAPQHRPVQRPPRRAHHRPARPDPARRRPAGAAPRAPRRPRRSPRRRWRPSARSPTVGARSWPSPWTPCPAWSTATAAAWSRSP